MWVPACLHGLGFPEQATPFTLPYLCLLILSASKVHTNTPPNCHQTSFELFLLKILPSLPLPSGDLTTPSSRPPLFYKLGSYTSPVIIEFCFHAYFLHKFEFSGGTACLICPDNAKTRHRVCHKVRSLYILLRKKERIKDFAHQPYSENKSIEVHNSRSD